MASSSEAWCSDSWGMDPRLAVRATNIAWRSDSRAQQRVMHMARAKRAARSARLPAACCCHKQLHVCQRHCKGLSVQGMAKLLWVLSGAFVRNASIGHGYTVCMPMWGCAQLVAARRAPHAVVGGRRPVAVAHRRPTIAAVAAAWRARTPRPCPSELHPPALVACVSQGRATQAR